MEEDDPLNNNNNEYVADPFNYSAIKCKLLNGELKINNREGRSNVWTIFGNVEDPRGQELYTDLVACRICYKIYKSNKRSTSNLVKHKCYMEIEENSAKDNSYRCELSIENARSLAGSNENDRVDSPTDFPEIDSLLGIKSKILSGEYKISCKQGRSNVWNIFGKIQNELGQELYSKLVVCRICYNIYKYNLSSTSNLVKHKCYLKQAEENNASIEVSADFKQEAVRIFTEWSIENCRSFKMVEDVGFKKLVEFLISLGATYGKQLDINSVLPNITTISGKIDDIYTTCLDVIKSEISSIKDIGFGLTADIWSDTYLNQSFLIFTMHYVRYGALFRRLLGINVINGKACTKQNIIVKAKRLLNYFNCDLEKYAVIVTDKEINMTTAFATYNHITCMTRLIQDAIQNVCGNVPAVNTLYKNCVNIVKHLGKFQQSTPIKSFMENFYTTSGDTVYAMFSFVGKNWQEISQHNHKDNEIVEISQININEINDILNIFEPFQDALKVLQDESNATLHLVIVYIHRLRKLCAVEPKDLEIIKELKAKLLKYFDSSIMPNVTTIHKIALFLFPPANKLIQYDTVERERIKSECKKIMETYLEEDLATNEEIDGDNNASTSAKDIFSDFIAQPDKTQNISAVDHEIEMYERIQIKFSDNFNVLQWWHQNKNTFPLLYKTSCKVLAAPASMAYSKDIISLARNFIADKKYIIHHKNVSINNIMFLHCNLENFDLETFFINENNVEP